jgi:O-antigen/teichoic acid export membrane protein/O-antigen ligase
LTTFTWRRRLRLALPGVPPSTVGSTIGARIASYVLGFGAAIITARGLGPHGRALLAVMTAVPGLFGVIAVLGLDNANARFAGQSHSAFRQIVRRSVLFAAVAGTAMAAAWWLAGSTWPRVLLGLTPALALLSAALCPVSLLLILLGSAEIGRGRVTVYNLVATAIATTYTAGVILLVVIGRLSVAGCFIACALSQLVGAVSLLVLATRRVHPDGERLPLRRYGSYAVRAYLPNVAQYGMLRMDVPFIQMLAGTSAVALYAVALPIGEALLLLPSSVALAIFPRVTSGAVDRKAADRIGRTVFAAAAILAAAAALAAPVIIPALYGAAYRGSVAVVWWMLPGLVIFSGGRTVQAYLAATDKLRLVIVATVAGITVCLAGLLLLSSRFGAPGAAAADSAGYLAFTIVLIGGLGRRARAAERLRRLLRSSWSAAVRVAFTTLRSAVRPALLCGAAGAAGLAGAALSVSSHATAMAGILILLVILAWPSGGLYLLAVAIPVSQTSFGALLLTDKDLAVIVIFCLAGQIAAGRLLRPTAGTAALAVTLVGYLMVSAMLADGGSSGQNWRYVLLLGIPLLCLPMSAGDHMAARRALVLLSCTAACLAVVEVLTARASLAASAAASAVDSATTAAGQTGAVNHNAEGALFVLALGVLLALFPRTRRGIAKLALGAAIVALALGVAYSFSRAAYLGGLAMIAVFAVRRSVPGLVRAAVGLGCLLPLLPAAVTARLGTVWNSNGQDIDAAVRLDLWSSALRIFEAHPVFGVGYLNFAPQLPAYFTDTGNYNSFLIQLSQLDFAHNIYLTVLAETGIVGAAGVGALMVIGWRRAWAAARSGDWAGEGAVLAFVGIGVCSAFGEVLLVPPILVAFLLAVLAAHDTTEPAHD